MKSIRSWLADTICKDGPIVVREIGTWLRADPTLMHLRHAVAARAASRAVVRELRQWLVRPEPVCVRQARAALGSPRAAGLTRSCLLEYLKQEGLLDELPFDGKAEVFALLSAFFVDTIDAAPSLAPSLPDVSPERAGPGTKPPEA